MQDAGKSSLSGWGLNRDRLVRSLETIQDLIVVSLCIGLFCFMVIQLREMFISLLPPLNFRVVTADILFLLILVELFRLLIIYLQEQRVSIGVAVEVSIVSVLREIIVRGVLEASPSQVLSACAFLLVMAILLVVRVWLPPTFNGIDPEKQISLRARAIAHEPFATPLTEPMNGKATTRKVEV
ncbi:MAG TPA: phosphate-starvation-inducible PsiE family protein [Synechococcales cyanobacterium M55_K2018_004]|nr:phosphate-starvation-inducible PsiE family protein [Synechococcales cyanobacterium M55_K2018_004]